MGKHYPRLACLPANQASLKGMPNAIHHLSMAIGDTRVRVAMILSWTMEKGGRTIEISLLMDFATCQNST